MAVLRELIATDRISLTAAGGQRPFKFIVVRLQPGLQGVIHGGLIVDGDLGGDHGHT